MGLIQQKITGATKNCLLPKPPDEREMITSYSDALKMIETSLSEK